MGRLGSLAGGGGLSRPRPRGEVGGSGGGVSRPTPGGVQAYTQGVSRPRPWGMYPSMH